MSISRIIDIATKKVNTIDENKRLNEAIASMYQNNHRDIIVTKEGSERYRLISVNDLIRFKKERVNFDIQIKELKIDHISTIRDNASLLEAFGELSSSRDYLCVIDENKELCGIVTSADIIGSIDPSEVIKVQKIKHVLVRNTVKQTSVDTPACDALDMMHNDIYDSVIIYDKAQAVGIVTTKDTVHLIHNGADLTKPIGEYMSSPLRTMDEETTIAEALEFLQEKRYKRIIVANKEGYITGYISQKELMAKIYSRWAENLKSRGKELKEINKILEERASKFEVMAQSDTLTGLANRNSFEDKMMDEFERIERYSSEPFSLIFFDIDHFKSINDTYGHLVGDQVLRSLSNLCKGLLRTTDMLARWGGEEFVAILPMIDANQAQIVAEKLRKHIEEYIFEQVGNITCSFGVTQYQKDDTPTAVLHRTDSAMYEAKKSGRNRVVSA